MSKKRRPKMKTPPWTGQAVGWNANEERLLALLVLSDDVAGRLSDMAGEAFFRAFIVQNRKTGAISMRWRFRYSNGKDSWFKIDHRPDSMTPEELVDDLRSGVFKVLCTAAERLSVKLVPLDMQAFEPPDDQGDFSNTIQWLRDMDLIHEPKVERAWDVQ